MTLICESVDLLYDEDKGNEIKNTKPFNYTVTLLSQQKLHACTEKGPLMLLASKTKASLSNPDRRSGDGGRFGREWGRES